MKLQFYVDSDADAKRCEESFGFRKPIAIDGADTLDRRTESYTALIIILCSRTIARRLTRLLYVKASAHLTAWRIARVPVA